MPITSIDLLVAREWRAVLGIGRGVMKLQGSLFLRLCLGLCLFACGADEAGLLDGGSGGSSVVDSAVSTVDSGRLDAGDAVCEASTPAECDKLAPCGAVYGVQADETERGTRFAACLPMESICESDETLRCVEGSGAALFVLHGLCGSAAGVKEQTRDDCADNLPERCSDQSTSQCEASEPWCAVIRGSGDSSLENKVALGCQTQGLACSDVVTCAHDGEGGSEHWFSDSCIPTGWVKCQRD